MIAEFRQELIEHVGNVDFKKFYDFMPVELSADSAFVIGDMTDLPRGDGHEGIDEWLLKRAVTLYCLVKIKDNKRAAAEDFAEDLAVSVMQALEVAQLSYNLKQRKSAGFTIGQYQFQGFELSLDFFLDETA